jgi:CDP-diacylglycerol--glycerol-3-phosphate 3-phosphatidyltransferase
MANLLTASRLLLVPLVLVTAWMGHVGLCLALFALALLTDVLDGRIARALGEASVLGARLDSAADCALYLTTPLAALVLFPWLREHELPTFAVVLAAYLAPIALGFAKFRRLTSYHTTSARITGVLTCATFFLLIATRAAWPFRIAAAALVLSALEEMAITWALDGWRADVGSLRRVLRDRAAPRTWPDVAPAEHHVSVSTPGFSGSSSPRSPLTHHSTRG